MSQALINRSLTNVRTELEFLYESNVITKSLYDNLISTLPEKYTGQPPVDLPEVTNEPIQRIHSSNTIGSATASPPLEKQYSNSIVSSMHSSSTNVEYAEAIYDFLPQQDSDLPLKRGDKVQVTEKLNADWWKGKIGHSQGVFPSNYVKLLSSSDQRSLAPPPQHQSRHSSTISQAPTSHHEQAIYNQNNSSSYSQPPFPPPSANYYPPQQQQQPPPQQVVVQQEPQQQPQQHRHHHLGKFGRQLKDAAVFGAGATIGSDIVNSIF